MAFDPLAALADSLGVDYWWLTAELDRRGLCPESLSVRILDGRADVSEVRDLLLDGPPSETEDVEAARP